MNNYIGLKYGRVRNTEFDETFLKNNAIVLSELETLLDEMHKGGWNIGGKSYLLIGELTLEEKNETTEKLCKILDLFFDMGVEIYNEWECRTHTTKESYRKYLFDYNKQEVPA